MNPEKKEEILNAAAKCFARFGFEKTTLEDIGNAVGLNKASLYYYYRNKESIFTEIIFLEAGRFLEGLRLKVDRVEDCRGKILTYLSERFRFILTLANLNQISHETAGKVQPLFERLYSQVNDQETEYLSGIFDRCTERREFRNRDSRRIAASLLLLTDAIRTKSPACRENRPVTEEELSAMTDDVVFRRSSSLTA